MPNISRVRFNFAGLSKVIESTTLFYINFKVIIDQSKNMWFSDYTAKTKIIKFVVEEIK